MCKTIAQWGGDTPYRLVVDREDTWPRVTRIEYLDQGKGGAVWRTAHDDGTFAREAFGRLISELASGSVKLVRR